MAKRRYRKNGNPTLLTVIIRLLIVAIFVAAVIIVVNRIAKINQNDRKKNQLEAAITYQGEESFLARFSFFARSAV